MLVKLDMKSRPAEVTLRWPAKLKIFRLVRADRCWMPASVRSSSLRWLSDLMSSLVRPATPIAPQDTP